MTVLAPEPMKQALKRHRRIVNEGAWAVAGQAVTAICMLVATRLITQFVKKETFGQVTLLMPIAVFGKALLITPILQAVQYHYHAFVLKGDLPVLRQTASRLLRWESILISTLILTGGIIFSLCDRSFTKLSFLFIAVFFMIDAARSLETVFLGMARRQAATSIISSIEAVSRPVLIIACVLLLGRRTDVILLSYVLIAAVALLATFRLFRRDGLEDRTVGSDQFRSLARELWHYGLPLVPLALVSQITSVSDRYIVGGFLGETGAGVYAAAYQVVSNPFIMAGGVLARTLQPVYFQTVAAGNRSGERRILRLWFLSLVGICGMGVLGVLVLRGWIVKLLLGPEFREGAYPLLPWIALGYCFHTIAGMLAAVLYAHKRPGRVVIAEAVTAVVSLLAPLLLIRPLGLRGVAIACPIYFSVMAATTYLLTLGIRRTDGAERPA